MVSATLSHPVGSSGFCRITSISICACLGSSRLFSSIFFSAISVCVCFWITSCLADASCASSFSCAFFSHPVIKSAIANSTRINPAIFFFIICPFFLQILCPDFQKELMRQHLNPNFQFFPVVCTWSFVPHSKCFHIRYSGTGVRIKVSVILLLYILCLTLKSPLHS